MNTESGHEGPVGWQKSLVICWMIATLLVFFVLFAPESLIARLTPGFLLDVREWLMSWFTAPAAI